VVYPTRCISGSVCQKLFKKTAWSAAISLLSAASAFAGTTTTTLAISPPTPLGSGIYTGSVLSVNATVTDSGAPVGAGTVSLCFAAATACTATNQLGSAQVVSTGTGKGTATVRIRLGAGQNQIKAFYSGTSTESSNISGSVTLRVSSPGGSATTTTIPAPSGIIGAYTFSGTVTGAGGLPLTGTINFLDSSNGNYRVGTAVLNSSSATTAYSYGTLAQGSTFDSSTTVPLVVTDVNQDGYPDLVVVTSAGAVELLFGNGSGSFPTLVTPAASGLPSAGVTALVAGDFNADGITDLAVVVGGALQVYLGSGGGVFTAGTTCIAAGNCSLGLGASQIVKGDFNYDGIQDLAVSNAGGGTVSVLLGVGDGTFQSSTAVSVGNGPTTLVAADFNGDGYTDLAVANTLDNSISIILGSATTMTANSPILSAGTASGLMVAGAFEGGSLDLVTANATSVYELVGSGPGGGGAFVAASTVETLGSTVTHLNVYDLERTSSVIDDLYVNTNNTETIFLGSVSSGFSELNPPGAITIGTTVTGEVAVADVDGDGLRDIVAVNSVSGGVDVTTGELIYTESTSSAAVPVPGPLGGSHNIVASYGGDTTYAGSTSTSVSVFTNQTGTTTALALAPVGEATQNETVTLTATVATATIPPATALGNETFTDVVTFFDGGVALSGTVTPVNGVATYTIPAIGLGTHNFTATYDLDNADPDFTQSTSPVETLYGAYPSTVILSTTPTGTFASSQIVTMTATVTPSAGPPATSGTINFCVTGSPCTGDSFLGSAQVVAATGVATIKVHLQPGSYTVQAFFLGTQAVSPSSSATTQLQVTASQLPDTLTLASPTLISSPPPTGTPYTYQFTASLAAATSLVPTGTLSFVDASNVNGLGQSFPLGTGAFSAVTNSVAVTDNAQTPTPVVGSNPDAVISADFNGDGYPDLAVTNAGDATVTILLNNGTGKLVPTTTVNVGGTPYALTYGDFNRDGHEDIAVANALGNSVTVLLGDGNGNFTAAPGSPISTGYTPTSIVTADFNNDGYLDLAVANYFDSSVSILYGDGNGGFTAGAPLTLADGANPLAIATGDVNSDGVPDLLISDSSGNLSLYLGNLSSGFPATATQTRATGADPTALELQDVNGDGFLDEIFTDYTGKAVDIYFGNGAGNFTAGPGRISVGSSPGSLIVGDFNGDGLVDVAVTTTVPTLLELLNTGNTTFAPAPAPAVPTPLIGVASGAVSADFGLNGAAGFGLTMGSLNEVDIALTQYSMQDAATSSTLTVYGGGAHNIEATYAGDGNFQQAVSNQVSVTGNLIPTSLTMGVTTAVTAGSTATLSATVAPESFDNYTATGTVTFSVNSTTICTSVAIDNTGTATCTTGVLTASPPATAATASYSGDTNFAPSTGSLSLTVPKTTPTITWATPASIGYGTSLSSTQLDATANVPGSFAYTPAAGAVLGVGTQTLSVTFTPTDSTDYNTATQTVSLVVTQGTPVITWATPSAITYGTALSATQLDATANVAGSFVYSPTSGTVLTVGTQTLSVTFTPTDSTDYTPVSAHVSLVVGQATPAITWATPAAAVYGNQLNGTVLNATANTLGTFVYSPAAGVILGVGSHLLTVNFTPTDTVDYTTASAQVTYVINKAPTFIGWGTPAAIIYGTALSATQLDAVASQPGTLLYSPAAGTILTVGAHTLQVTFTPTDTVDYDTQTDSVTLVVNKATPVLTWPTPSSISYGTALSATQLDATANTAGTFTYAPPAGTVLPAGTDTLTVNFTPTDTTDYTTASAFVSLVVTQGTPVITWTTPAAISYGTPLSATQLDATSNVAGSFSYSPVAGTVLTAGSHLLTTTFTPSDTSDYTTMNATVTVVVNPSPATITWATPASITYGTALSGTQLNATANVAGSFSYSPVAGTVLTVGSHVITATFTPTDTTDYTVTPATVTLVVTQANATITWATPASISYGTALSGTQLDATANVAGSFSYSPAAGTVLTAGSHVLTATFTPTDTTDYAVTTATVTLVVTQANAVITWATPAAISFGTVLSGTQLNATANVAGSFTYSPAAGTSLTVGSHVLTATFTPTDTANYAVTTATVTQVVSPASATITWATPAPIGYGIALSGAQLDATANVPGSFSYSPAAGTVLTVGSHLLTATFTPTDTTDYSVTTANVTQVVSGTAPTITWPTPAAISYGTALSGTQLDATANVAGSFSFSPVAGTVLTVGSHTLSATFTPTDTTDYSTATATVTLVVTQPGVVITWATPAAISYGTALSSTQLDATANVAGSFSYSPAAGAVLTVGSHVLTATFTPTDTTDYSVTTATVTLVVTAASPAITWPTPAAITYGTALSAAQLDATASVAGSFSYSPALGTVLGAGVHTLTVTFTPTDTTDNSTATATVQLTVNQAVLTVTAASFTIGLTQTIPSLTASITGFVNGDVSFSSISGSPTLTLTPASPTVPGAYPIVAALGTLASANYSFKFVNGVLTINKGTAGVALTAPATANLNGTVTLTVTLSPSTTVLPTGSVSILDGTTPIGSGLIGTSNVLSIPVTFTTTGNHTITAVYAGDLDYTGNTSTASIINVLAASYSITISPSNLTIHAGQSALTTITMNSYGGYTGSVTLGCVGLPVWAGCTFAPTTLTADGSGTPVSSKMTIQTLGNATGVVTALNSTPGGRNAVTLAEIWLPLGLASLLLMGFSGRRRVAVKKLLLLLLSVGVLASISGCGSADCCSVPEATAGTYQVTISATTSAGAAQTAAFTLQVLQ
jgi:hypothetical protein